MHINEFPVELLSQIFELSIDRLCFTPNDLHPFLHSFRQNDAPLNLIHVCQRWRAIGLSTTSLWASLSGEQLKPFRTSVAEMTYWLQFSRKAPLHLRLSSRRDSKGLLFDHKHATKMLHLFATHLDRWQSLSIYADPQFTREIITVLRDSGRNLPPLEALEVKLDSQMTQFMVDEFSTYLYPIDTLRHLYWTTGYGYSIPVGIPWHRLHTLSIETSFGAEESIMLLSQCVAARQVTLCGFGRDLRCTSTQFHHPHTTLSNLTSLTLRKSSDPLNLLRYFALPALISLDIQVSQRNFTHLEEFLERSKCPLETLNVVDPTSSNDDIIDFFRIPYLRFIPNVKLNVKKGEQQMLEILQSHEDAKTIFPRLMVWEDLNWPVGLGWMKSVPAALLYSYQDGHLTFSPSNTI